MNLPKRKKGCQSDYDNCDHNDQGSLVYDLWGTVFYFYTTTILLASLVLVFYPRLGWYVLSQAVTTFAIGLNALECDRPSAARAAHF